MAPRALALRQRVDRGVDADRRHLREPDEPGRVGRAELFEQEVVVRLDAGEQEVVVVVAEEVAHRALGREQDLGPHAVDVHVLEALDAVVATGARLFVGDAEPAELVVRHTRRGDEPDRVGVAADGREPGVAAHGVLHELRRLVLVLLGQPVRPDVGRLEDVAVGVDDAVLLHDLCSNRVCSPGAGPTLG